MRLSRFVVGGLLAVGLAGCGTSAASHPSKVQPTTTTTTTTPTSTATAPTTTSTTVVPATTPPPAAATVAPVTPAPTVPPTAPPTLAPATSPPPAAVSCHPLTNGGNCYEPGEYCRASDHGVTGLAGDGETITCEDNNGWRWEP